MFNVYYYLVKEYYVDSIDDNKEITEGFYLFSEEDKANKFRDRMNDVADALDTGFKYDVIAVKLIR